MWQSVVVHCSVCVCVLCMQMCPKSQNLRRVSVGRDLADLIPAPCHGHLPLNQEFALNLLLEIFPKTPIFNIIFEVPVLHIPLKLTFYPLSMAGLVP